MSKVDLYGSSDSKNWKPGIYFTTFEELATNTVCVITDKKKLEESKRKLRNHLRLTLCPDGDDRKIIDNVMVYKTPLNWIGQWTSFYYHGFILLKIGNLFVTLDKHTDGLTVQSSKEKNNVLTNLRNTKRYGDPQNVVAAEGTITVGELIDFIMTNDFINQTYNFWRGHHCKMFAKDIFDKVANKVEYDWEQGELELKLGTILGFSVVAAVAMIA